MNDHSAREKLSTYFQDAFSTILVLLVIYFAVTLDIERGKYAIIFLGLSYVIIILKNIRTGKFLHLRGNALVTAGICVIGLFLVATGLEPRAHPALCGVCAASQRKSRRIQPVGCDSRCSNFCPTVFYHLV